MDIKKNVYTIIDGQAGSCGKGKAIGQFVTENKVEAAIANCLPNAGHTFEENGRKRVFRHIPVSAVNVDTQLFIGAGAAIDMDVLEEEYENNKDILENREIIIHPLVPLIEKRHKEEEKKRLKSGSTFKGGGAALADRLMRNPELKFFKSFKNIHADNNYHEKLMKYLDDSDKVLIEGSQGCDLSLYCSEHYPNVTSRPVNVAQMFSDSEISPSRLKETQMVIRPFPIRISNKTELNKDIYSGNYGKSEELTWEQINTGAFLGQYPTQIDKYDIENYEGFDMTDFSEKTTVTQKTRRVFDIDINLLKETIQKNTPSNLYLNFFQHLGDQYTNIKGGEEVYIDKYQRWYLNWLEAELEVPITFLGTGADNSQYIDRRKIYSKKRTR